MAKKKEESTLPDNSHMIIPDGAMFLNVVQLERDRHPSPAAQRINMLVNRGGKLYSYISENPFVRSELFTHLNQILVKGYGESIGQGMATMSPYLWRIHWVEFTPEFCNEGIGKRMNPITGEPVDPKADDPKYFSPVVSA